jgi:hypothetical protein
MNQTTHIILAPAASPEPVGAGSTALTGRHSA